MGVSSQEEEHRQINELFKPDLLSQLLIWRLKLQQLTAEVPAQQHSQDCPLLGQSRCSDVQTGRWEQNWHLSVTLQGCTGVCPSPAQAQEELLVIITVQTLSPYKSNREGETHTQNPNRQRFAVICGGNAIQQASNGNAYQAKRARQDRQMFNSET